MASTLSDIWGLLKKSATNWLDHKAARLGAALAYYTVFSIAPLLIIVVAIAGLAFGEQAARGQIERQISGLVGTSSAETIQTMVQKFNQPGSGVIATIIGLGTILVGSVGLFSQLQDALNTIWQVVPKPGRGIWGTVKEYFASFAMVVVIGFLLLVSLIISAGISAIGAWMERLLPVPEVVLQAINFLISLGVVTLLFALIFKILPDVRIRWGDVWLGALVTAILFTIGKFLIGLYLGKSSVTSAYGAAGSLVVVLLWVYYSSQILLYGAEFTQVYANRFGGKIQPTSNAMFVTDKIRADQGIPNAGKSMNR